MLFIHMSVDKGDSDLCFGCYYKQTCKYSCSA